MTMFVSKEQTLSAPIAEVTNSLGDFFDRLTLVNLTQQGEDMMTFVVDETGFCLQKAKYDTGEKACIISIATPGAAGICSILLLQDAQEMPETRMKFIGSPLAWSALHANGMLTAIGYRTD